MVEYLLHTYTADHNARCTCTCASQLKQGLTGLVRKTMPANKISNETYPENKRAATCRGTKKIELDVLKRCEDTANVCMPSLYSKLYN